MRYVAGCVLLGALLGVRVCGAEAVEPTADTASAQRVVLPKLPLSAADASLPRFEIVAGRAVMVSSGLTGKGPTTRPARAGAGAGQPIPTDVRAVTALLPTDIRHQVTLCDGPAGQKLEGSK